tara:strand:- start:1450 stop:2133 length:684 start_codon:yes stop_codon:yes gene_type:complete
MIKKYGEPKHYINRPLCRFDIINYFIEKNNYLNYLEIGVRAPQACFNRIIASHKDAVDPAPLQPGEINYPVTSDEFFQLLENNPEIKYDIIFIDGLHLYEQVKKDISNSLNHLTDNGTIVMHDCSPPSIHHQRTNYGDYSTPAGSDWNGTTWRAFVELRCTNPNLNMSVVDTDYGVGIIQKGNQQVWDKENIETCMTYEYLDKNRKDLLNLFNVEQFEQNYKTGFLK